jgi:murein DD-endopeptidase MepM/ murein hydrolase activator NlpD
MSAHRIRSFVVLIPLCFLVAAAAAQDAAAKNPDAAAPPALAILASAQLRPGDPLLAWMVADSAVAPQRLELRLLDSSGKEVEKAHCFDASSMLEAVGAGAPDVRLFGALMSVPTDLAPGDYGLAVGPLPSLAFAKLIVVERDFPLETIPLDEANSGIRTVPSKRKDDEARRLYAVLEKTDDTAVFADGRSFLFPVEGGFKSAGFGDRRRYLLASGSSETSVHAGLDWAVVKGTAVRACERGKVVLVADREVTGKTIVIEHLPGLYSLYFHLSAVEAKEGSIVERGDEIARSGSTGMSTGPHLHWELRAKGDAVDPEYWLNGALLDKEAIKAKITALIEGR